MENIKLYVMNEEQRKKALERAIKLGLRVYGGANIDDIVYSFLYFDFEDMDITDDNDFNYFKSFNDHEELTFEQWMSYEPEPEEMTDSEILGKVWRHRARTVFYSIIGYDPKSGYRFRIGNQWYSKKYVLENFESAESLIAVAKENE